MLLLKLLNKKLKFIDVYFLEWKKINVNFNINLIFEI